MISTLTFHLPSPLLQSFPSASTDSRNNDLLLLSGLPTYEDANPRPPTVAAPGLLADQQPRRLKHGSPPPPSPPSLPSSEIHNTPSPTTTPAQSRIPNPQALESLPPAPGPENMSISSTRSSNGNSRIWPPTREKETSGWVACKPVDSSSLPLFHFGSIFVFFTFLVNTIHGLFVFKLRPRRVERESTKELFIGSGMNEERYSNDSKREVGGWGFD